jgi:predicted outer membrane protein
VRHRFAPGLFLTCALAACGGGHSSEAPIAERVDAGEAADGDAADGDAGDAGPVVTCSDGAVAAILAAEEQADIDFAIAVRDQLQSPDAIAFAEKEITDHTLLLLGLKQDAVDDGIPLVPDDDAEAVTQSMQLATQSVQSIHPGAGLAVDRAYIARALLGHMQDAALLEALLAPSARDVRIASIIRQHRTLVAGHEALAVEVQRGLGGACGVAPAAPLRK